jgi:hypothetical protein
MKNGKFLVPVRGCTHPTHISNPPKHRRCHDQKYANQWPHNAKERQWRKHDHQRRQQQKAGSEALGKCPSGPVPSSPFFGQCLYVSLFHACCWYALRRWTIPQNRRS